MKGTKSLRRIGLAAVLLLSTSATAHAGWNCVTYWSAYTTERTMLGTRAECACGIPFHTCRESWVDIAGGVSQACDNHSRSFKGWTGAECKTGGGLCEWNMCDEWNLQQSLSLEWIDSVNQNWNRFPTVWGCPPPAVVYMNDPWFTVYDLDGCINKQLVGSLYFADFPLYATKVSGDCSDPYSTVIYRLTGGDQVHCCGGDAVTRRTTESYYDPMCSATRGSYICRAAGEPCYCPCDFECTTCEPGQPCQCPAGCECRCTDWECSPGETGPFGTGLCKRYITETKFPSCEGGTSNRKLCSDLKVVGDYICTWS